MTAPSPGAATGPEAPIVSVVVPTYERPDALAACLRALAEQTLATERFEVIVCDDGSRAAVTKENADLVARHRGLLRVRLVRAANAGPAAARNRGAAAARGRYLAFTDDDCEPAPDWLERLLAGFSVRPEALFGGGLRNGTACGVYSAATQAIMDFVYECQEIDSRPRRFSTSNLSLPAAGFRAVGGFSDEFRAAAAEDYDLCARWIESGRSAEYRPEAVVVHGHRLSLRGYLGQHLRYGRGLLRLERRRRGRRGAGGLPKPGWYLRLILSPLRRRRDLPSWRCAALIALSQLATAAGAARELLRPSHRPTRASAPPTTAESS